MSSTVTGKTYSPESCDCVEKAVELPRAELGDTSKPKPCEAEYQAFIGVKWKTPPGKDKAAKIVEDFFHACFTVLSDARMAAANDPATP